MHVATIRTETRRGGRLLSDETIERIVHDVYGNAYVTRGTVLEKIREFAAYDRCAYNAVQIPSYQQAYLADAPSMLRTRIRSAVVQRAGSALHVSCESPIDARAYRTFRRALTAGLVKERRAVLNSDVDIAARNYRQYQHIGSYWNVCHAEDILREARARARVSDRSLREKISQAIDDAERHVIETLVGDAFATRALREVRAYARDVLRIGPKNVRRLMPPRAFYATQLCTVQPVEPVYAFGDASGTRVDPWSYRAHAYASLLERFTQLPHSTKDARRIELFAAIDPKAPAIPQERWGLLSQPTRHALYAAKGDLAWRVLVGELATYMQNRPSDAYVTRLLRILRKYDPDVYLSRIGTTTIDITAPQDAAELKRAAMATKIHCQGSCIAEESRSVFALMLEDPGTRFLVARTKGSLTGYARMFLMRSDADLVVAVDTIEPPRKQFEEHLDLVNAFALAAIDVGLAMGARMVVGKDARIKFGPRQAYGNYRKDVQLEKIGFQRPVKMYDFAIGGLQEAYVLMESWRP